MFLVGGLSSTSVPAAAVRGPLPQARGPLWHHDMQDLRGPATAAGSTALGDPMPGLAGPAGRQGTTQQDSSQTQACLELIQVFSHSSVQTCFVLVSAAHLLLFCVL